MVKRLLSVLVALVGLLLLAGAAAWWLRDPLAASVANRLLLGTGWRVTAVSGLQPFASRTTIDGLVVEQTGSGQMQRFSDIEVTYRIDGLRSGRIRDVRVGRAELVLPAGADPPAPADEEQRLSDMAARLREAPLESLTVEELHIADRTMSLMLRWQEDRWTAQLGDGEADIHAEVVWPVGAADQAESSPLAGVPFAADFRAQMASGDALSLRLEVARQDGMLDVRAATDFTSDTAQPVLDALAQRLSLPVAVPPNLSLAADLEVLARVPDAVAMPDRLELAVEVGAGGNVVIPASLFTAESDAMLEARWDAPVTLGAGRSGSGSPADWTVNGDHLALSVVEIRTGKIVVTGLTATLSGLRLRCRATTECEFSAGGAAEAASVTYGAQDSDSSEAIRLREPSLTLPMLEGVLVDDVLSIRMPTDTQFTLPEAVYRALSARDSEATLHDEATLDLPMADREGLRLQTGELAVNLPLLRSGDAMAGLQLQVLGLDTRPLGPLELNARIRLSNAYTNLFPVNLWDATLTAEIAAENDAIDLEATATLNGTDVLMLNGRHELPAARGEGQVTVPDLTFDDAGNRLSDFVSPLPVPVDLVAGTLGGQAELSWRLPDGARTPVLTGALDFALTDIAGFHDSIGFVDLATRLEAQLREGWRLQSLTAAPIRIGELDVGFPIRNVEADYQFDTAAPSIRLTDARMALFGGRITADRLVYDAGRETNTSMLRLEQIDIERLLSLSAYEGITATGIVGGEIPLTIRGTQFTVSGGSIAALPPGGTISYRGGSTDTGNNNLDLVYRALRNYRYSKLEADVDYRADGELLLGVRMEGVAPAIDNQRINLNVNIQDNIPSLLESLQAGRDIAESIPLWQGGRR